MATESIVAEDLIRAGEPAQDGPSDSSQMLLGLVALSRRAEATTGADPLSGVISHDLLRGLLAALHFRDVSTLHHCRRTAQLASGIASQLGVAEPDASRLEIAALLHDLGKIGVPDNLLFKPGRLTADEANLMALHRNIGLDLLQASRADGAVLEIITWSHQYAEDAARGLKRAADDVPTEARIVAIADVFDTLTTDQDYQAGMACDEAVQALRTDFDGKIVSALAKWIEREGWAPGNVDGGTPPPADPSEAQTICTIASYLYMLESLYDGFSVVDSDRRFVVWNRGAERLLGYPAGEVLGRVWTCGMLRQTDANGQALVERDYPLNKAIGEGRGTARQIRVERPDGQWAEVETQAVPLLDRGGRLHGVAEIYRDLSRTRHRVSSEQRELQLAASRDPLTSLANRSELETQLTDLVSNYTHCSDDTFSLILLDLDFFKEINDAQGHAIGDQVLVDVGKLLQDDLYSGELIGRYGGEEFLILCPDTNLEQATRRAERLRTSVTRTTFAGLRDQKITASFGVVQVEEGDSDLTLLGRVEQALQQAKEKGRNTTCTLTRSDLQTDKAAAREVEEQPVNPFLYEGTFEACIGADMVVYKLGGFVRDHKVKVKQVSPKRTRLRMGNRSLLGFWGSSDDMQPVEIEIEFSDEKQLRPHERRSAARYIDVHVRIRPLGWIRNSQKFRDRAKRVMKLIRSYFVVG